eukprot:g2473.t1
MAGSPHPVVEALRESVAQRVRNRAAHTWRSRTCAFAFLCVSLIAAFPVFIATLRKSARFHLDLRAHEQEEAATTNILLNMEHCEVGFGTLLPQQYSDLRWRSWATGEVQPEDEDDHDVVVLVEMISLPFTGTHFSGAVTNGSLTNKTFFGTAKLDSPAYLIARGYLTCTITVLIGKSVPSGTVGLSVMANASAILMSGTSSADADISTPPEGHRLRYLTVQGNSTKVKLEGTAAVLNLDVGLKGLGSSCSVSNMEAMASARIVTESGDISLRSQRAVHLKSLKASRKYYVLSADCLGHHMTARGCFDSRLESANGNNSTNATADKITDLYLFPRSATSRAGPTHLSVESHTGTIYLDVSEELITAQQQMTPK